ncbi:MAG: class I SAM-dependent methyltransferase [Bacteroidales bacterium]|nr:class I SAM-dependent methyltransferase [Bacteroidales bacterium]
MKEKIFENDINKMPNLAFRGMKLVFKICYAIKPIDKYINSFNIKQGFTIIDYGCGPGGYVKRASELVGNKGLVYAVDIHELAISSVNKLKRKYSLNNVIAVHTDGITVDINNNTADLIYALDMFHMVKDTNGFLKELNRIAKPDSILIIEDGHQARDLSKEKIMKSECWEITEEQKKHIKCKPIK